MSQLGLGPLARESNKQSSAVEKNAMQLFAFWNFFTQEL
jgi:hypothetical protein